MQDLDKSGNQSINQSEAGDKELETMLEIINPRIQVKRQPEAIKPKKFQPL